VAMIAVRRTGNGRKLTGLLVSPLLRKRSSAICSKIW
jgi:hypothetical protein